MLTVHRNSCDLCKPIARAPKSGELAPQRCAGHQGHPDCTDEMRWIDAAPELVQRSTVGGNK